MNGVTTKMVCDYYYRMLTSDWRKTELLLKIMDRMLSGGQKLKDLERLMGDVDYGAIVRAASFQMNLANGDKSDPLAAAIAHISD